MTLPVQDSDFGQRVQRRLREEQVIWFVTSGDDETPQPNPVWFLWDGGDSVLIYNDIKAKRLEHVAVRPRVALHFNDDDGGDVVVLAGVAEQDLEAPAPDFNAEYLEKYRDGIAALGTDAEGFARRWSVPLRVRVTKVRGH
jgi:PPOX class probable F420-dependent enzyme